MDLVLKAHTIVWAILVSSMVAFGIANRSSGDPVSPDVLAATRGGSPNYTGVPNRNICQCKVAQLQGITCVCTPNDAGAQCAQCTGMSVVAALAGQGSGSIQPAGTNGQCNILAFQTGTCDGNSCTNPINQGNCPSTYPYAGVQSIIVTRLGEPDSPRNEAEIRGISVHGLKTGIADRASERGRSIP